jgi:hypothetical protein
MRAVMITAAQLGPSVIRKIPSAAGTAGDRISTIATI